MKVLLLVASGWIGRNIIKQRPNWKWICIDSKICDLEDHNQIQKIYGSYDVIIHSAGFYGGLPFNIKHKENILFKNTRMNANICDLVKKTKPKKFIIVGSGCVYPPKGDTILKEHMVGSLDFHPTVKYSSLANLQLLQMAKNLDIDFEHLLISNAYGPGEHTSQEKSHIMGSLIGKIIASKDHLEMMGTGSGIRDYIFIQDVAEAVCKYCELEHTTNSCTNISNSVGIKVKEIVEILLKFSGKKLEIVWGDANDDGVRCKILDNSKMVKDIGFSPKTNIKDGLIQTWNFFNSNKKFK